MITVIIIAGAFAFVKSFLKNIFEFFKVFCKEAFCRNQVLPARGPMPGVAPRTQAPDAAGGSSARRHRNLHKAQKARPSRTRDAPKNREPEVLCKRRGVPGRRAGARSRNVPSAPALKNTRAGKRRSPESAGARKAPRPESAEARRGPETPARRTIPGFTARTQAPDAAAHPIKSKA